MASQDDLSLEGFVDRMMNEKPFADITDPGVRAQIKADYVQRLEDIINAAMIRALPQQKLPECERLIDSGNPEQIQQFFARNISNLPDLVAKELMDFRAKYVPG